MNLSTSRYNFAIPVEQGIVIFCAKTGAAILLQGKDHQLTAQQICTAPQAFNGSLLEAALVQRLTEAGFLIAADEDELLAVRTQYWRARRETPLVVTITTTMDCNLGCYYCYEQRSPDRLDQADIPSLVDHVRRRIEESQAKSLHVDWYGGEPLLNVDFLEAASVALQSLCGSLRVKYAASVISNGTSWPQDVASFVSEHAIRQVQISFDGLRENHNQRRRFRAGYDSNGQSSFDLAVGLIDKLIHVVRVDVRINIDRRNRDDVAPFIEFMRERGWFDGPFPVTVQPARLAAYSEHSHFMRSYELTAEEYDELRRMVRQIAGSQVTVEESEAPDGYPWPRTSVCAALAPHSDVIGADGFTYRCGLQVGEKHRRMDHVCRPPAINSKHELPLLSDQNNGIGRDQEFWERFDPTRQSTCSRCSFLPICWGGCPKKHLEGDLHALAEQGEYWRRNLARLVTQHLDLPMPVEVAFSEEDQFR